MQIEQEVRRHCSHPRLCQMLYEVSLPSEAAQQWLGLEDTQTIWPTQLAQVPEAVLERVPVTWGCNV